MINLYPHQREAVRKLKNGSILWAATGTGKSITALAYFCEVECNHMKRPRDLLIITTARKRDTQEWEGECIKAGLSVYGDQKKQIIRIQIDSWNNIEKYAETTGKFIIFDEQRATGSGPWARTFVRMARHNHWILLSATPGDKWVEYWSVFVAHGFYRTKTEFMRRHAVYSPFVTKYPKLIGYMHEDELSRYRSEILVGMHFEKKTIPHHITTTTEYDHDLYDYIRDNRFDPMTEKPVRDAAQLCGLLRRVVNEDIRKMAEVERIMRYHPKAIIFYNFDYELEMLRDLSSPTAEWNGHRHDPLPEGNRWAYLVQYSAGAEGWNCVSTDTMIFFSRSYSYKAMEQARGRIDRLNTGYDHLYYYYLVTDAGIDKAIGRALEEKKDFNESAYYDTLVEGG